MFESEVQHSTDPRNRRGFLTANRDERYVPPPRPSLEFPDMSAAAARRRETMASTERLTAQTTNRAAARDRNIQNIRTNFQRQTQIIFPDLSERFKTSLMEAEERVRDLVGDENPFTTQNYNRLYESYLRPNTHMPRRTLPTFRTNFNLYAADKLDLYSTEKFIRDEIQREFDAYNTFLIDIYRNSVKEAIDNINLDRSRKNLPPIDPLKFYQYSGGSAAESGRVAW